jgi:hypothetical protein
MKKAEQILEDYDYACYRGTCHKELFSISEVTKLLKQAQEDAIRETVKECNQDAELVYNNGELTTAILSVADKLIQQL